LTPLGWKGVPELGVPVVMSNWTREPTLSGPHRREVASACPQRGGPTPANRRRTGADPKAGTSRCSAHSIQTGATSEEAAPAAYRWAEVAAPTRRFVPDRPEQKPSAEAERNRCRAPSSRSGKPPSTNEGTRGAEFVRDNTQDHDWPSCATSESSDPTFRRKTDRRIATSPSDLTPMRESDTPSLYPFAHHRPLPIVDPQQAARSAVNTRVIASDPASTRQLRFREPSRRFHPTTRRTRLGAQQKIRCFERSRHGHIVWSV
jgi:hypothetical protein